MFILTDGKNYVMENPMKQGNYVSTTSPVQAKEFTWSQARSLLRNKKKSLGWIRTFYTVDLDTKKTEKNIKYYKGNGGAYIGKNDVKFDDSIIEKYLMRQNLLLG